MNWVGIGEGGAAGAERLALNVVEVYQDPELGLRARQTLEQIVRRLEADAEVQVSVWDFDVLRERTLRQRAATQAAEADIVIVAMHGQGELPPSVNSFFEWWFGLKGPEPCALVLSLDEAAEGRPGAAQMVETLRAAARLAGVEVFLHLGDARAEVESAIENIQGRAETRTRVLDEILHRAERFPFGAWGINE